MQMGGCAKKCFCDNAMNEEDEAKMTKALREVDREAKRERESKGGTGSERERERKRKEDFSCTVFDFLPACLLAAGVVVIT